MYTILVFQGKNTFHSSLDACDAIYPSLSKGHLTKFSIRRYCSCRTRRKRGWGRSSCGRPSDDQQKNHRTGLILPVTKYCSDGLISSDP